MSVTRSISCSAAAIFSADEGCGLPRPNIDIIAFVGLSLENCFGICGLNRGWWLWLWLFGLMMVSNSSCELGSGRPLAAGKQPINSFFFPVLTDLNLPSP